MAGSSTGWFKSGSGAKDKVFIRRALLEGYIADSPARSRAPGTIDDRVRALRAEMATDPELVWWVETKTEPTPPAGMAKRKAPAAPAEAPTAAFEYGEFKGPLRRVSRRNALAKQIIANGIKEAGWSGVVTPEEYEAQVMSTLRRVIDGTDISMRVPTDVLETILDEGFKNQHETRTSKGWFDPKYRAAAELNMFDIPGGSTPDSYPIYGYLSEKGGESSGPSRYGGAQIIFKDSVRDRTTFTVGDSLGPATNNKLMPTPLGQPGISAVNGNADRLTSGDGLSVADTLATVDYFETQIHGKTTAADIAEVRFTSPISPILENRLDALGIKWAVVAAPEKKFLRGKTVAPMLD